MHFRILTILIISVLPGLSLGQQLYFPLDREINLQLEEYLYENDSSFHSGLKPYLESRVNVPVDSLGYLLIGKNPNYRSLLGRKLLQEGLITIDTGDLKLEFNPLMQFEFGNDLVTDTSTFVNTRGFLVRGAIGKNFSFQSDFRENQAKFIPYLNEYVDSTNVVPGQGMVKDFKGTAFDYAKSSGYISYSPSEIFNFQFGHGKNFIGDGYRSLLLSDNTFNYPFLKITTSIWKFQYTNLFASFQNMNRGLLDAPHTYVLGFQKKLGTFHYLNINVTDNLELGFFEAVIWQSADSTGKRGFDVNYLNPVIFYRPVEFSLNSPDNAIMGANAKLRILKKNILYGQLVIDDLNNSKKSGKGFFQNKFGHQVGVKMFDLFNINNLHFQTEYNTVRPYTYAHKTPLQSYTHFNQPLAHPLGANFRESVSFLNYRHKRVSFQFKFNYAKYGADTSGSHWGRNIFRTDFEAQREGAQYSFGNETGQGVNTNLTYKDLQVGYLINPRTNLKFIVGFIQRKENSLIRDRKTNYLYFSLQTSLSNFYYDF